MADPSIFLSYAEDSEGERAAQELREALSSMHVNAIVARDSIPIGADWQRTIGNFLEESIALICVGTASYSSRPWCQQEIGWALGRHVPILWIQYDPDEVPAGFITSRQALLPRDSEGGEEIARRIITWLSNTDATRTRVRDALLSALEASDSFDDTRHCADLLTLTGALTAAEWDRVVSASTSNRQVRDATEWTANRHRRYKTSILRWLDERVGPSTVASQR